MPRLGHIDAPVRLSPRSKEAFETLSELALDLRWSWSHAADEVWRELDPALWDQTRNPWIVVNTISHVRMRQALSDSRFRKMLDGLVQERRRYLDAPAWFQRDHPESGLTGVAYFSMEFMLSEALPIYSGGLGNVAGDQLKAASDLGVPVTGVGLLYQQGYFRQVIDRNGRQLAVLPYNDPGQLPVSAVRDPDGEWVRVQIPLPGGPIWLRCWQVQVGRARLYLLDSNDASNSPTYRGITGQLYGGDAEVRLQQELILGIGGWRVLEALGLRPEVCHLNEGHAAFAALERARTFMQESGQPFDAALAATRAGNLFTTHTAVEAGFDRFPPDLIRQYLACYAEQELRIPLSDLMALGRRKPDDPYESFNMAYLAIHASGCVNGVSRLHGSVSRDLFASLFPRWPVDEVPVGYVTNGVHVPSWDSEASDAVWTRALGKNRWREPTETHEKRIRRIPDAEIWQMRNEGRRNLIERVRSRVSQQLSSVGAQAYELDRAKSLFDPDILTLGFARRFAPYKRPNLLLTDPDRLARLLTAAGRPVQILVAGKAHPADQAGQRLIEAWTRFTARPIVRDRAVFLADYDMALTEELAHGVDVWINTPRRPWEASGTSGMKVLVNGGLNLSELDGWWAEAYRREVGWAIGDGQEHADEARWDAAEAEALYTLLEREIVPEFYARDGAGIPAAWVARVRESMACLTPRFSANRVVREYTEQHYLPAACAYRERAADNGAEGRQLAAWRQNVEREWSAVRFGHVTVKVGKTEYRFEVEVFLGRVSQNAVQVELYADAAGGHELVRKQMSRMPPVPDSGAGFLYCATVPANRPATDYTACVVPFRPGAVIPLEAAPILWQR